MSGKFHLIALTLVALIVAASSAQAGGRQSAPPKVDPLAVSYLIGLGLSPSEVESWTVGVCSQADKPASCFAVLDRAAAATSTKVDPLAVSYLIGRGLTPSEVRAWTVGICSQASKPSVCYTALERASAGSPAEIGGTGGFHWGDASIGAGVVLGIALLIAGLGATLMMSRHHHPRPPTVHA